MLSLMHKLSVKKGDFIFVDGGVPHAIGGGCLLCELQEPTDYMVIPERTSKSGITLTDRKMHGGLGFDKMMDCFVYSGLTKEQLKEKYFYHPVFVPNKLTGIVGEPLTDKFSMYVVGVITDGSCAVDTKNASKQLKSGESFIISANNGPVKFSGNAEMIFCMP